MKKTVKLVSVLALLLIACTFCLAGCKTKEPEGATEGAKTFTFEVIHLSGEKKEMTLTVDSQTVGEALLSMGLIEGENGPYGLYVLTVDGEYHKYEEDGRYWAFYINGEYAMTGVDATAVEEGAIYTMKVE